MRLRYKVRYFQEDDWWLAEVPDIAGGQMTQGETLEEAESIAERAASSVSGRVFHRSDIGTRESLEKRCRHMREIA